MPNHPRGVICTAEGGSKIDCHDTLMRCRATVLPGARCEGRPQNDELDQNCDSYGSGERTIQRPYSQGPESTAFRESRQRKELGLALKASVRFDVENGEMVNVKLRVDDFSIGGKKVELLDTAIITDAQVSDRHEILWSC